MIRVFLVALILSPAFLWAQDAVKRDEHQMHGLHNDPKAYIGSLEDPKRDAYQKPHEVLTALNLKPAKSSPTSAPAPVILLSVFRTLSAPKAKSTLSTSAPT